MYSCGHKDKSRERKSVLKPTYLMQGKAAVSLALWRVNATPPESETRSCIHRGNPGTRESQMFP